MDVPGLLWIKITTFKLAFISRLFIRSLGVLYELHKLLVLKSFIDRFPTDHIHDRAILDIYSHCISYIIYSLN